MACFSSFYLCEVTLLFKRRQGRKTDDRKRDGEGYEHMANNKDHLYSLSKN